MRKLTMMCLAAGACVLASTGVNGSQGRGAPRSLVVAVYPGQDQAGEVLRTLQGAQDKTGERIESYAIVSKAPDGQVTVRDQRRTGAGAGAVVGGVIGLFGGPLGAAAGAAAGGAVGYLTGRAVGIPPATVTAMKDSLTPDSSAFIAVIEKRWLQDIERGLKQAKARQVIASDIADIEE